MPASDVQRSDCSQLTEKLTPIRSRTLERVADICKQRGKPFPRHLVVQSDNTVAQAKNTCANLYMAVLVARHKFITTNLFDLLVGHTHEDSCRFAVPARKAKHGGLSLSHLLVPTSPEDVDQLFGLLLSLIVRKREFEELGELMPYLKYALLDRIRQKGEELFVEKITAVRDFAEWMSCVGITLHNAFGTRQGIESPHAFTFKLRRDLLATAREWLQASPDVKCHDDDVYCCVKTYMRDTDLQQAPVLVLPYSRAQRLRLAAPTKVIPLHELSPKTIEQLLTLALTCEEFLGLPRAAGALRDLVHTREYHLPSDVWLCSPGVSHPLLEVGGNPYFQHLPPQSWQLLVKHHR